MNPRVYLLDEPFASIDRKSRLEILEILKELALDGKTVILCDHDLSDYEALYRPYGGAKRRPVKGGVSNPLL